MEMVAQIGVLVVIFSVCQTLLAAQAPSIRNGLVGAPIALKAVPIDMHNVRLDPTSLFGIAQNRNLEYLLSLDDSRLTCLYTSAANLTGTFEHPTCNAYPHPQYWGHYLGHYLSATAQAFASTGNEDIKNKSAGVVAILGGCQDAWTKVGLQGYLFPYSVIAFDNLEHPPGNCKPVCVPWYVFHKMLAGLLDQFQLAGNTQALDMAKQMAAWTQSNVESVLQRGGEALWQEVLDTEWGGLLHGTLSSHQGMNEALYNLYGITNDANHFKTAAYFNHWSWSAPLAINQDDLTGMHANTHIPEIAGEARGYELSGNETQKAIAVNFFNILNSTRTFATGGSNDYEHWGAPFQLGDQLNSETEESCTQYNILKVARHFFLWTANSSYFDFYERAILNGLIGNQNRLDPAMTSFIYMLPLGTGSTKPWGRSNDGFPCCWGTLSETFAKLTDSIYFQSPDASSLYVNQFVSSTVAWPEQGLLVRQVAGFPTSLTSTTLITFESLPTTSGMKGANTTWTLNVRVPWWAYAGQNSISVNGRELPQSLYPPGSYFSYTQQWAVGDTVSVHFPLALRYEALKDNRSPFNTFNAIMYGPLLLVGLTNTNHLVYDPANVDASIQRTSGGDALLFRARDYCNNTVVFKPLMDVVLETYSVYFSPSPLEPSVPYSPTGSAVAVNATNLQPSGGAGIVDNQGQSNLRSGDPGEVNEVAVMEVLMDAVHPVKSLSFSYRYVSGYGPAGRQVGTNFSVVIGSLCNSSSSAVTIYRSPDLTDYPFDVCSNCYSPPVPVHVDGLAISVRTASVIKFVFQNNDRNVQLLLPMQLEVGW